MRRCCLTTTAWPRSRRTGQRSQWMTDRPPSSRITCVPLSEPADEAGSAESRRAQSTQVLVVARRYPAAWRTARKGVARRSQIKSRVAAIASDDHAACYFTRHRSTLTDACGEKVRNSDVWGRDPSSELVPAAECLAERDLVGVLQIGADRQATRQPRDGYCRRAFAQEVRDVERRR